MDEIRHGDDRSAGALKWRILVVDDEEFDRMTIQSLLEKRGHTVRVASSGNEALSVTSQFRPHLMLVDINLPGMNGHEICEQIRAEPWGKTVSIFAMTGLNRFQNLDRARKAGFDGFLGKPIDGAAIDRLLRG